MIWKLIYHYWLMFRRSELFTKSVIVLILLGFTFLFVAHFLNLAGQMLPGILQQILPSRQPGEWVFGLLIPIFVTDLFVRIAFQPLPQRNVTPYLHLPISRKATFAFWMMRAWANPFNIYLLFFFSGFIKMTINPETGNQTAGLAGIFLLSMINQSLTMWVRFPGTGKTAAIATLSALLVSAAVAFLLATDLMISETLKVFLAFTRLEPWAFVAVAIPTILIHFIIYRLHLRNFYPFDQGTKQKIRQGKPNLIEIILLQSKEYGKLWQLEYRLIVRNKRSVNNLWSMLIMYALFGANILISKSNHESVYMMYMVILSGGFGYIYLQYAFSWESHYFDFLASRNINMEEYIRARFYFYTGANLPLIFLLSVLLNVYQPQHLYFFVAISIYSCGFGYFFLLYTGITSSTRFDANKGSAFNMEGVTGLRFLQIILLFISFIFFLIVGAYLPFENADTFLIAITGTGFIVTNKWWIKALANKYNKRRHTNLELYRKK